MPPDQTSSDGTDPPKGSGTEGAGILTEERVQELISKAIGVRLDAYDKRIAKTLDGRLSDTVSKVTEVLEEKLSALRPAPAPDGEPKPKDLDIENHPIVKGLKKRLDESEAKMKQNEEHALAERAKARSAALRIKLGEALAERGITGQRQAIALGHLIDAKKAVEWSEDDAESVVFKDGKEAFDLKTGLDSWVKSDEGKLFQPPRGVSGSGDNQPRGGPRTNGAGDGMPSKADLGTALLRTFSRG